MAIQTHAMPRRESCTARWRNFMRTGSVSVTPGPDAAEAGKKERPRAVNEPLALLTKAVC